MNLPKNFFDKKALALFALSVATIAFELAIMRVFSVGNWSAFGAMVISIALLGSGIAGTLITFLQKKVREAPEKWLKGTALLLLPAMALSLILSQQVPFNPTLLVSEKIQWLWIALNYLLYSIPFFISALFIGVIFTSYSSNAGKLYFWNMVGSGIGGFILLGLMFLLPTRWLIIPILGLTGGGIFLLMTEKNDKPGLDIQGLIKLSVLLIASLTATIIWGDIKVSLHKGTAQAKVTFSDLREVHYEFSPLGEMEVFHSSQYHFAPGLSDNAVFNLDEMPKDAFWALYINGDGPINIMRKLKEDEEIYMDFLPISAPYTIKEEPNVLLVKLGGGFSAHNAEYHDASEITIVESNSKLVKMMQENPEIREFTEDLFNRENVHIEVEEPRAYTSQRRNREKFDIVEISLIDSIGLSNSVGDPLFENYTYTTEAIEDYWKALAPDGVLAITTWNTIAPPRNVPRMLTTVIQGLRDSGVEDPENKIFAFNLLYNTATILVKKDGFSEDELYSLNKFCRKTSFEAFWYPGIADRDHIDFEKQLEAYRIKYETPLDQIQPGSESELYQRHPADLYYYTAKWLFEGKEKELYDKYLFDIRPSKDSRPYFTAFMKPETTRMFMDELRGIAEEWGYLLLIVTLIQAVLFGLLIIFIPVLGSKNRFQSTAKDLMGVIIYFACLGLAYMFIEIYLISKLVFFLGDPIFSTSIVITAMLILSGLGSLYSSNFKKRDKKKNLRIAAIITASTAVLYILVLPMILRALLGWPLIIKMVISLIMIAPAAFCMGMFFPTGLSSLSDKDKNLVPWAWGINGALSVTGSILPKIISIHGGFATVLIIAAILYLIAGFIFPVNMKKE